MTRKEPMPPKVCLIVNPSAGRGRARRGLGRIRRAFAREGITDARLTSAGGDEEHFARKAMDQGMETIVAVGGDGTCSRIANAILERGSSCRLAVVPAGTGNDFAKTLGVARADAATIARLCRGSSITRMDVGRVDRLFFLNGCGFGIDPEILAATLRVRWLQGNAVYISTALRKLFTYRGLEVEEPGAQSFGSGKLMMITVSNGRYLGGAFKIAPAASVCDGRLDLHIFKDAGPLRRLRVFHSALRGTHPELPEVVFERRFSIGLHFAAAPQMEVDGELRQAESGDVAVECVAGALSVVAAPGHPL